MNTSCFCLNKKRFHNIKLYLLFFTKLFKLYELSKQVIVWDCSDQETAAKQLYAVYMLKPHDRRIDWETLNMIWRCCWLEVTLLSDLQKQLLASYTPDLANSAFVFLCIDDPLWKNLTMWTIYKNLKTWFNCCFVNPEHFWIDNRLSHLLNHNPFPQPNYVNYS